MALSFTEAGALQLLTELLKAVHAEFLAFTQAALAVLTDVLKADQAAFMPALIEATEVEE